MRVLLDADAIIKLATSTAKESYVRAVTVYLSPGSAKEATRGPPGGMTPDAEMIRANIARGHLILAGGGRIPAPPAPKIRGHGDEDILSWATSPEFDLVVTDDARLQRRLRTRTGLGVSLCASIVSLVVNGRLDKEEATAMLRKLEGRVNDMDRIRALYRLEAIE